MDRKKCIIFGAGDRGTRLYKKLSLDHDVIAYSDNDPNLWGAQRNHIGIVPPAELAKLAEDTNAAIVIANDEHYLDIAKQLDDLALSYYICNNLDHLSCMLEGSVLYPAAISRPEAYRKPNKEKFAVLFVQNMPCTRTDKIAEALKEKGVLTYSAHTTGPSDAGERAFCKEYPIWTYADLLDFVNESEFDVIHCSNTPDILVNILLHSNKKVIHDCHDVATLHKKRVSLAEMGMELIANRQAAGVIYPTEQIREIMARSYGIKKERTLVVGNYPLSAFGQTERLPKLSASDGAIHCVYEGALVSREHAKNMPRRFYEPIFVQLARLGVHVHIYSHRAPDYLRQLDDEYENIHYEGNYSGRELITRMTQYDVGLICVPWEDIYYAEIASANKVYEYLAAGLPVATNVKTYAEIIEANQCGGTLDWGGDDAVEKLRSYQNIFIPMDFCDTHGFTMDANVERILEFYKKV